jgi:Flp pilus assembly protein TadG
MARLKRLIRDERGAELIEFAAAFLMLLILMCGIFDFGLLLQRYEVLTNAAREGARLAALPGYTEADVIGRVNAYLSATGVPAGAVTTLTFAPATAGGRTFNVATVTITYVHGLDFVGPLMGLDSATLNAVAAMRVESQGGS